MARKYPRFLLSNSSNSKSSGIFIIHTLEPRFIARPEFDKRRNLYNSDLIDVWSEEHDIMEVYKIIGEMPEWFRNSGIYQSSHEHDQMISAVMRLDFLAEYETHFTVDEARKLIRLLFPTKAKSTNRSTSSYGLKHLFEKISTRVLGRNSATKYCSNDTTKVAFEQEGFNWEQDGPNRFMNLSEKEVNRAYMLFNLN